MKKFAGEFKEFIMRGNVMDMAVGVIIGGAFQAIVTSLIDNIIMPLIGLITGGMDFKEQFVILKLPEGVEAADVTSFDKAKELGVNVFGYGAFITAVINFLIMALVIFMLVKAINKIANARKKEEPEEEPTTKKCPHCCEEVNINATKCPHCTGDIPEEEKKEDKKKKK